MNILVTDLENLGEDIDFEGLKAFGNILFCKNLNHATLLESLREYKPEIIISNRTVFSAEIMHTARDSGLKLIALAATGTNTVPIQEARALGIEVRNVKFYSTNAVAELTLLCALEHCHKIRALSLKVADGSLLKSQQWTIFQPKTHELNNKNWGIIGLGAIGKRVIELAEVFGVKTFFSSLSGIKREEKTVQQSLPELFRNSDIISIHAPYNASYENIINYDLLKTMKKDACIINMGRGGIIHENDLAQALEENLLGHAFLDVLRPEPPREDNPLLSRSIKDKITITPHIAWSAIETRQRLIDEVGLNIEAYIKGLVRNKI